MRKNQEGDGSADSKKEEPSRHVSYHGGSSKAILQWHFIILLCLAVISLVLVSTYGHSHKGVQPSKATRRNRSTGTIRVTKGVAPCTVTAREITCSDIVGNTGEFIADYINQNSGSWPASTYKLNIKNCTFPGHALSSGWLPLLNTNIIISELHIQTYAPITIEGNAFNDKNFQYVTYLTLEDRITELKEECFKGLKHLDMLDLRIEGTFLDFVAQGILNDVPNIQTLQITSNINDNNLNNFLCNTNLSKLKTLSINNNDLRELKSDTLSGLTNIVELNAMSSNLVIIESTILASSANSIQKVNFADNKLQSLPLDIFNIKSDRTSFQVFLHKNNLKTLPEGIFNKAIRNSGTVAVNLAHNDWHCDCDLAWLQQFIENKTIILLDDEPDCESPKENRDKPLRNADFSACITTSVSPTTLSSIPSTMGTTTIDSTTSYTMVATTTDSTISTELVTSTTDSTTSSALVTSTTDSTTSSGLVTSTTDSTSSVLATSTTESTTSALTTTTTDSTTSALVTTTDSTTSCALVTTTSSGLLTTDSTTSSGLVTTTTDSTTSGAMETTTNDSTTSPALVTSDFTVSSTQTTTDSTTSPAFVSTTPDSTTSATMEITTNVYITSPTMETTNESGIPSTVETTTKLTTSSTLKTTDDFPMSSTKGTTTTSTVTSSSDAPATTDITSPFTTRWDTTSHEPFSSSTTVVTGSSSSIFTTGTVTNEFTTLYTTDSTGTYKYVNCTCTTCSEHSIHILTERNNVETSFVSFNSIQRFEIVEDDMNKKLKVRIQANNEYLLVWMNTDGTNSIHCNYTYFMKEKRNSLNIFSAEFKTKPNTSYTMCAISQKVTISPLNCRAYTTLPSEEYRPWLLNNQQAMIWAIFCSALLVSVMIGGVFIYTLVRNNPRLIKGNKRVIVVGHRAGEVMVMPKECLETDTGFRRTSETSYYTARTSKTSYVTAIQPTPVQLIAWKFNRMWDRLTASGETDKSSSPKQPPPLPPYPKETSLRGSYEINFPYDCNSCYTTVV